MMEALEANYPGIKVFSLPSVGEEGRRRHIELGVRGSHGEVPGALEELKRGVSETGREMGGARRASGSGGGGIVKLV